jgi:hypothetical protein
MHSRGTRRDSSASVMKAGKASTPNRVIDVSPAGPPLNVRYGSIMTPSENRPREAESRRHARMLNTTSATKNHWSNPAGVKSVKRSRKNGCNVTAAMNRAPIDVSPLNPACASANASGWPNVAPR